MRARQKNLLIGALLAIVFTMAVGYAAFAQNLTINATTSIDSQWNVKIQSIEVNQVNDSDDVTGTATIENEPVVVGDTEARFSSILRSPGDSIKYKVTIKNEGTLKAKVADIKWVLENGAPDTNAESYCMIGQTVGQVLCTVDDPIYYEYEGLSVNSVINPNATQTIYVTAIYYDEFTYQPTLFPSYYSTGYMPSYQSGAVTISGNSYFEKDAILHLDYVQTA